jgi:hypothetical protein
MSTLSDKLKTIAAPAPTTGSAPAPTTPAASSVPVTGSSSSSSSGSSSSNNSSGGLPSWAKYLLILGIIGLLLLGIIYYFAKPYLASMSSLLSLMGYGKPPSPSSKATSTSGDGKASPRGAAAPTVNAHKMVEEEKADLMGDDDSEEIKKVGAEVNIKPRIKNKKSFPEPVPDDAGSSTQASKAKSKAGFCYIGEDRGFRSCIKVGEGEKCMSGDIFPTQDLCINPRLRQ